MHENTLIKIALCCILLGLPALYIITDALRIDDVAGRVSGTFKEESVTGKVSSVMNDDEKTTIIITSELIISDNVNIPLNATVTATGRNEQGQFTATEVRVD